MKWKIPLVIILVFILFSIIFKTKENFYMAQIIDSNSHGHYRSNGRDSSARWFNENMNGNDCLQTCLNWDWCRTAGLRSRTWAPGSTNIYCELNDTNPKISGTRDDQFQTFVKIPYA